MIGQRVLERGANGWSSKGGLNDGDSPDGGREPLSSRCESYEMIGENQIGGLDEAQVV